MAQEIDVSELMKQHRDLDRQIDEALSHPGIDELEIAELKKKKLSLKDEIAKLESSESKVA
ncbi:MAG: DUF465 domain-containing protein [Fimbriimonadaceae bacterium]|nr:DUF465 domain-containing protein [Alphaproteobacteria bacterium]